MQQLSQPPAPIICVGTAPFYFVVHPGLAIILPNCLSRSRGGCTRNLPVPLQAINNAIVAVLVMFGALQLAVVVTSLIIRPTCAPVSYTAPYL